jgi:hypothetical protein
MPVTETDRKRVKPTNQNHQRAPTFLPVCGPNNFKVANQKHGHRHSLKLVFRNVTIKTTAR